MQLNATPIFVDINLQNYTIDLDDFRKKATSQIKARYQSIYLEMILRSLRLKKSVVKMIFI